MSTKVSSSLINTVSASQIVATGATAGQVLTYNDSTSTWVASAAPGGDASAIGSLRAWVNFKGTPTTSLSYTRSGTTVTVTHNSHGYSSGMIGEFTSATDTGVNGTGKVITVINANSYSFQTSATGANGTLTQRSMIRASGNVSSIVSNGTGDYTVNFATAMPDTNYSFNFGSGTGNSRWCWLYNGTFNTDDSSSGKTTTSFRMIYSGTTGGGADNAQLSVNIIR